jgi:signal transduction histidine kinase
MKQKLINENPKFLLFLFVGVLAAGVASTFLVYRGVSNSSKGSLLTRANTIAQLLDPREFTSLEGSEADLENPVYLNLKDQFTRARSQNPDTRFIYALGRQGDEIFFYLDSEPDDSGDYSAPGDVYFEASTELRQAFLYKKPFLESFFEDRWGTWISALSPVIDQSTGDVVAIVGMDIDASVYTRTVRTTTAIPVLVTLFLLTVLGAYWYMRRREIQRLLINAEMVSLASHEIRSPLNGISWASQSLLKSTAKKITKSQTDTLTLIRNSSENMIRIVNDLLDLYAMSRTKAVGGWEHFDLGEVISESVLGFELDARKRKVTLEFAALVSSAQVYGEKPKIRRVINNLVSNALKYSRERGQVRVTLKKQGEDYMITVTDQGIGVPAKDQDKIFGGFYRAANAKVSSANGTGLGLYYARQIIESHGGRVWLKSQENKGSTFFIRLPSDKERKY